MNKLKHHFLWWLVFLGTITFWYIWYSAYTSLSIQNDWAVITKDIWNNVINTINSIWTKTDNLETKTSNIYQSWWNIWIWISNPSAKLDLNWNLNINWIPLNKVFHIRSSDRNVKCININYSPAWYTDDECIWLLNWYAYYDWASQEAFPIYSDINCATLLHARWMYNVTYWDKINSVWYMKVPVLTWYYNELFCQKWMIQEDILY